MKEEDKDKVGPPKYSEETKEELGLSTDSSSESGSSSESSRSAPPNKRAAPDKKRGNGTARNDKSQTYAS